EPITRLVSPCLRLYARGIRAGRRSHPGLVHEVVREPLGNGLRSGKTAGDRGSAASQRQTGTAFRPGYEPSPRTTAKCGAASSDGIRAKVVRFGRACTRDAKTD